MIFPFFLIPSFASVTLRFSIYGFAFFQHHHTILVRGTLQILQYLPFIMCPLSACLFILHRSSFANPHIFLTVFLSDILSTVVCSWSLSNPLTHRSVWVVLGVLYCLSLVFRARSLDLESIKCARNGWFADVFWSECLPTFCFHCLQLLANTCSCLRMQI